MAFFSEFEFTGAGILAKETGAEIKWSPAFARDAVRVASFIGMVQGVRAARVVQGRGPRARISFYPRKPRSYYAIWPVCQLADVKIVDNPAEADLHFYFEDREFRTAPLSSPSARPALNSACNDIRKSAVSRIFGEVFGYELRIDPAQHSGLAVEKSEANGKHDGRIVSCPLREPRADLVYQKLIDNTFDGREFIDIRTPVVGGKIPFVYLKRRTRDLRFSNDNHRVDLAPTDAMLSANEQAQIARFTQRIGLDFGGLDVLRDREDGRIYIVDANKTDMGPPSALASHNKLKAMRGLADAFAALVESRIKD